MGQESNRLSGLRLGDILQAHRLVTPDQLHEALLLIKAEGGRLGESLIRLGYLAEPDLKRSLALQLGLAFDPGPDLELDLAQARLVTEQTAQRLQALPLRLDGSALLVALADPLNYLALDDIALKSGRQVRPVVVTNTTLQRAIVRVFGLPEMAAEAEATGTIYQLTAAVENPVERLVNTLLIQALSRRASDVHIEPFEDQLRVRCRVDGELQELTPLPLSRHAALISRIKVMARMDIAERRVPQDGQASLLYDGQRIDLRISTVPTIHGERMAIRLLERSRGVRSLSELGMPEPEASRYLEIISRPNGLILVTGPTGSGKSTTLMATVSSLNRPGANILTVEDPVEYQVPGVGQVQINPKAGLTFAAGLRAFLRQDPDILMVGEIRDGETADIALRAALTGHLVLSTLHTNQAAGAVGRLAEMGGERYLLASSLLGVVAQRLVRVLCTRCKRPYQVPADSPFRHLPGFPHGPVTLWRPGGCGFCDHAGYAGRRAIFELLPITPRLADMIAGGATPAAIQAEAVAQGLMRTLWQTGLEQALAGMTSFEEVRKVAFAEA